MSTVPAANEQTNGNCDPKMPKINGHGAVAKKMPIHKYRAFQDWYQIPFDDKWPKRSWPEKRLSKAPRWCSVDLRDGNQALINPMNFQKKMLLFQHLLRLGYKEIEVGFPAASQTEYDFIRHIIEEKLIPDDVWIQVLTQAREPLIRRTVECVTGAKNIVLHIYNSTSELQRRVVFNKGRDEIKNMAVEGVKLLKELRDSELSASNVRLEYSPESFTGTELDFAVEVSEAVMDVWQPTPEDQVIINVPATVEMATPNVYADQIEWVCAHLTRRDCVCVSLHPHNDRGTGTAAAELAMMAGADRVEGCLFGNGERTGNVCLVTLALNLFTQGIDPMVDFSSLDETISIAEYCTELKVPERYPWAGSLVYTAFSGSHQDAIKKGLAALNVEGANGWEVPYLPIDPVDIGRKYEALIRVNSQSGKGGIAYVLETEYGIELPKEAQAEFATVVQQITDNSGREILSKDIYQAFLSTYIDCLDPFSLVDYDMTKDSTKTVVLDFDTLVTARILFGGESLELSGRGNGPIAAFVTGLNTLFEGVQISLNDYHSSARAHCQAAQSSEAVAVVRCEVSRGKDAGICKYGVGIHGNTTTAVLEAVISALNRIAASGETFAAAPSK
eukprot:CAMPEP_0170594084 /NCGR_PEP_ID=MMETSP0224-20130122/13805_1 /TAXON_ID=285029 /ORGANISM="Togula jolla, Strain CCCM 725" /LENGTH=615 /DNA_ID=CAMNT_0010918105 /DNA_START=54 /DNA_END=1901 /DNA_ORIENTATION=-